MRYIELSGKDLLTLNGQDIPKVIAEYFACRSNQLSSLEFGPKEVHGNYFCNNNKLTSLDFCATKIGDGLYAGSNLITNLKDIHKQFRNGYIGNTFNIEFNPIKSHVLGVILIPKLKNFYSNNRLIYDIINKHLKSGRDVLDCQEELIQNGFKEFAQL